MWKLPALLLLVSVAGVACGESRGWDWVDRAIDDRFPEVRSLSTERLQAELQAVPDGGVPPLLIDAREQAEFSVSHLPGAVHAQSIEAVRALTGTDSARPIVVYCSVGYRSAELARRLEAAGYSDVRNLRGSIFRWANERRALTSAEGPTTVVHPYNRTWGRLLDKQNWPADWRGSPAA